MADENNNNQLASTTGHEDEKISVEGLKSALQKFKTNLLDAGLAGKVATSTYNALVTRVEAIEQLMGDATTPDSDNIINKVREMIAFFVNIAETDTLTGLLTNLETRVREQYAYVTTLNSAPTSSTLTYTIGSGASAVTYNFKLGDEVRVADNQHGTDESHGYIYYKLYDLVTVDNVTTAYWDLVGGGIPEVEIGSTTPVDEVKLFVDEDDDPPASFDVYTREQTDGLLDGKVSNPIEITSLSADYTFSKGDTIVVGTGLYKCTAASTTLPPFNFVFDANGSIVVDVINGEEAVVVDSDTLNTGWEKVMDVSDRHYTEMRILDSTKNKANKATTLAGYNIGDAYTKTQVDALTRHTRLTDFDLNTLKKAVADQNLEKYGLKVGDQKTINDRTYVIAGLNPMKGTTTPYRVTTNHVGLIVIPHTTQAWNASGNTSTGADGRGAGYLNSDLHYYIENTLLPLVETDIGVANLIGHSKLLSNSVDANAVNRSGGNYVGASNNWNQVANCKICALSEFQVYGGTVWSSSSFDTAEACRQLEVFQKYSHTEVFGDESPWLRDVASNSYAADAESIGYAGIRAVSNARHVAALILFH